MHRDKYIDPTKSDINIHGIAGNIATPKYFNI